MRRFLLILILWLTMHPANAQGDMEFEFRDLFLNDYADLLEPDAALSIRRQLSALKANSDIDFTIVTIRAMNHHSNIRPMSAFADALFEKWVQGHPGRSDGILLIVSRFDNQIWVKSGSGFDTQALQRMWEKEAVNVKRLNLRQELQARILNDVDRVVGILVKKPAPENTRQEAEPNPPEPSTLPEFDITKPDLKIHGQRISPPPLPPRPVPEPKIELERNIHWIGMALGFLVLGFLTFLPRLFQSSRKICPRDGHNMRLLTGEESEVRQQSFKGKDRAAKRCRVWVCDQCDHVVRQAQSSMFSKRGACRNCGTKTIEGDSRIVKHSSKITTGQRRVDYTCKNCHAGYSRFLNIPRLPRTQT